ncbi:hypothetical protein AGDE_02455 [Angomonas deanei]|nr:hypothetical protein AGDE_02455 [Angomonas deanei]|eukprot:EPY41469.1 hypothetical protein AGDE_02455 [Angomonas deanei]
MTDAKEELERIITEPQLNAAALLVFCNKQDLPHHLTPGQIVQQFGFKDPNTTFGRALVGRQWYVQGCCAHSGEGLFEGLDWLCSHLPSS